MTATHRGTVLLLAVAPPVLGFASTGAAAQERPPYIEFDVTGFTGRNLFLVTDDRKVTAGAEVAAQAGTTLDVDAKTTLDVDGRLAYRRYNRRYGDFVTGFGKAALDYRGSERFSASTAASFERLLPLEGTNGTIDAAIDPVSMQDRYEIKQSLRWRPDQYMTISGEAAWSRLSPRGSQLLRRTDATSFALGAERRLSTFSWMGVGSGAIFSKASDGSKSDSALFVFKAGTRIRSHLSVEGQVGVSKISQHEPGRPSEDTPFQFATSVSLCYDPRRLRVCLAGQITPAVTGFGGIQREKALTTTFVFQTSERGTLSASSEYRSVPNPAFGPDAKVVSLSTTYEHRLDDRFRLHVGADYDRRTGMTTQTQSSWSIRVGVTFRIPSR
ncbi:MAG: hypothetical protein QM681_13910 [Novosphingobium sp.]